MKEIAFNFFNTLQEGLSSWEETLPCTLFQWKCYYQNLVFMKGIHVLGIYNFS